ncbi:urease accessory protein UreE [Phenylobacterium sp. LjRoot219]|uniref:urease accessory protein UreE n=1 Tax=Phenylobacterium sp. LjRoot219 TaxID=3342283 RepID=UPI003ED04F08
MSTTIDMARLTEVLPAGSWTGAPADRVVLDYDGRHRRRVVLTGAAGGQYLLDLPEATHLKNGDGLRSTEGAIVEVAALAEPLLEIRAATTPDLLRLAWHLGNRHLAAAIRADHILIRRDHVIAHMLEHQGAVVAEVMAVFDPEAGAYHVHGHGHDH